MARFTSPRHHRLSPQTTPPPAPARWSQPSPADSNKPQFAPTRPANRTSILPSSATLDTTTPQPRHGPKFSLKYFLSLLKRTQPGQPPALRHTRSPRMRRCARRRPRPSGPFSRKKSQRHSSSNPGRQPPPQHNVSATPSDMRFAENLSVLHRTKRSKAPRSERRRRKLPLCGV